jgi:hypothetical protein
MLTFKSQYGVERNREEGENNDNRFFIYLGITKREHTTTLIHTTTIMHDEY